MRRLSDGTCKGHNRQSHHGEEQHVDNQGGVLPPGAPVLAVLVPSKLSFFSTTYRAEWAGEVRHFCIEKVENGRQDALA